MTREEKNKLKRKAKWNFIIGLVLLGLISINIISILVFDMNEYLNHNELSVFVIISLCFILISVIGMMFLFSASNKQETELYERKIQLQKKRNKLHTKQFWNKITEGKYDEALELFQHETLIPLNSDLRFISLGILLGMMQQNGKLATKWDTNPMEKMNKILSDDSDS